MYIMYGIFIVTTIHDQHNTGHDPELLILIMMLVPNFPILVKPPLECDILNVQTCVYDGWYALR